MMLPALGSLAVLLTASCVALGLVARASNFSGTTLLISVAAAGILAAVGMETHRFMRSEASDPARPQLRTRAANLRDGVCSGIVVFGLATLVAAVVVWGSEQLLLRQASFPLIGTLVSLILQPFGGFSATAAGEVSALARDGQLIFSISTAKLGIPLLAFSAAAVAIATTTTRIALRPLAAGLLLVAAVLLLRVATEIALYCDQERVLVMDFPSQLATFVDPWRQLPWMLALGFGLASLGWFSAQPPIPTRRPSRGLSASLCAIALLGGSGVAMLSQLRLPTQTLNGKVLIDDFHSEYWGLAGRQMQPDWFGDFSTYNLSAMTEYLGHHYPVSVNRSRRYGPGSLDDVSVLILKTPTVDFDATEIETILSFVKEGGGLILIGDHTNLMGMSSRLNQFAMPAGIAFVFDAVSNGRFGSFSVSPTPDVPHPIRGANSGPVEFMTGCSLRVGMGVDPLLVAPEELRIRGDYSAGSFFGRLYNDPRADLGPVAHAAAAGYGRGTVVAYSDSTCLSSFGIFLYERARFMTRAVEYAGRAPMRFATARRIALWLALAAALVAIWWSLRSMTPVWKLLGTGSGIAGLWLGLMAANQIHRSAWPDPAPAKQPPAVQYMSANTLSLLPPVLGSSSALPMERVFDTCYAAIPRTGRYPSLLRSLFDWTGEEPLIHFLPASPLSEVGRNLWQQRLRDGATALVGVSSSSVGFEVMESMLRDTSLGIRYANEADKIVEFTASPEDRVDLLAGGRIKLYETRVGKGRLLLAVGAEHWSREALGHAFAIPTPNARELYDALYTTLDRLGPTPGDRRTYAIE